MVSLLDYLKLDTVDVMAVSAGGPTAIYLAADHPHRVNILVLVSALTKPWQDRARYETVKNVFR